MRNNKIKWFIRKGSDMNLLRSTWKQQEQVRPSVQKRFKERQTEGKLKHILVEFSAKLTNKVDCLR